MAETFQYDVFLSHSSKDKPAVRELAERLKADGVSVWLDEWAIQPGDMIGLQVEKGLEQSRILVLVMSPNTFASDWVTLERHTVMFRDPTNRERRFIPLLLAETTIPDTLKQFLYIDWRERSDEQYTRILNSCRLAPEIASVKLAPKTEYTTAILLQSHSQAVQCVAITPDGKKIVSGASDHTLRIWDMQTGQLLAKLEGHSKSVYCVAITPDGKKIVSGAIDHTLRIWDMQTGQSLAKLEGHSDSVLCVAITPDGNKIVSGARDNTLRIWDIQTGQSLAKLEGHSETVYCVVITSDGNKIVSGARDETLRIWDIQTGQSLAKLEGHRDSVWCVAITQDGKKIVSGSVDKTLHIWDLQTGQSLAELEGHSGYVRGVAITPDGKKIVSGSDDHTLRIWDMHTGQSLAELGGHSDLITCVAITPDGNKIVSGSKDKTLHIWDMPSFEVATGEATALRYTNAKVLLVGDSGVGKSGLALRLTKNRFEPTVSTDAAWATQISLPHNASTNDIEREIWLWDFAGQSDYRLIHQLYMDETALAAFVFNPQSENPFEGLGQWDRDLQRASRRPFRKLLVAGRCDRVGLMVSQETIDRFVQERGFESYLQTSAQTGDGCKELQTAIIDNIAWDTIPWTASPRIFKLLKEEIVKLKDEGKALLRMSELKQQLEMRLPNEAFTIEELRAVVGLLAGPGIVWQLEFGDFVLLQPERINAYAAAAIRKVRAHTDELGFLLEDDVQSGNLDYQDMKRLPHDEEAIVLRAMHQTFIEHGLCLREMTDKGGLLVFPSYFKRERPKLADNPTVCVTYQFNGALDEIYATLVVRLHHTTAFDKDKLWRFAADFKILGSKRAGLKMTRQPEGAAEMAVYFDAGVADEIKAMFIGYVHDHLKTKGQDVVRERHYVCPFCETPVESRTAIRKRLERGENDIPCGNCEKRVPLWDIIEQRFASEDLQQKVREMERKALESIDNESRELILVGHAFSIAGEAGQIFRPISNSDWGIDGEIEFKNDDGNASGRRVYLQLKSGDSYLYKRKSDDQEIFTIKNDRQAEYWQSQAYPVMLVVRTSNGEIRWMDVSAYLKKNGSKTKQIKFDGQPFTAVDLIRYRNRVMALAS